MEEEIGRSALIWAIAAGVIGGILFRPKGWPEAIWATTGAALLAAFGLIPVSRAWSAVERGTDVYLFLAGMMLLAEMARHYGVFDWLAAHAVHAARGSRARLFGLVYAAGAAVTVFLSNDATAVVLTPAVYAAVRRAGAAPMPYLLVCAFVANAASFVLPVSNPANLVVYGKSLPALAPWLRTFLAPSVCSVGATFVALRWLCRKDLEGRTADGTEPHRLAVDGRRAAWGLAFSGGVLLSASALGLSLGLPVFVAAAAVVVAATRARWPALREIAAGAPWSVLPFVAGLFVLVEALSETGASVAGARLLESCASFGAIGSAIGSATGANLAVSFGVAALSNLMNNLPAALLARSSLDASAVAARLRDAVLIGIDLGPNLSVTGSLATVLWLLAIRREGERVSGWLFLKVGLLAMPSALALAALSLRF